MTLTTEDKRNVLRRVSGEIFGQGRLASTWSQSDLLARMSQFTGRRLNGGPDEAEAPAWTAPKQVAGEQPAAPVPA